MRLKSLASIIAANVRGDYGRASYECGKWKGNLVITTTKPATPRAYTVGTEAKSPLDHGAAMRSGYQFKITRSNRAMTHKCQCQNMQIRTNDIQSRNLQTNIDSRDRGSLASIARPRKLSILPIKTAMTLYCITNYLHRIYESRYPSLALYGTTDMEISISV
eukprot:2432005-Pleurochrysis_carterae.AAC.1